MTADEAGGGEEEDDETELTAAGGVGEIDERFEIGGGNGNRGVPTFVCPTVCDGGG